MIKFSENKTKVDVWPPNNNHKKNPFFSFFFDHWMIFEFIQFCFVGWRVIVWKAKNINKYRKVTHRRSAVFVVMFLRFGFDQFFVFSKERKRNHQHLQDEWCLFIIGPCTVISWDFMFVLSEFWTCWPTLRACWGGSESMLGWIREHAGVDQRALLFLFWDELKNSKFSWFVSPAQNLSTGNLFHWAYYGECCSQTTSSNRPCTGHIGLNPKQNTKICSLLSLPIFIQQLFGPVLVTSKDFDWITRACCLPWRGWGSEEKWKRPQRRTSQEPWVKKWPLANDPIESQKRNPLPLPCFLVRVCLSKGRWVHRRFQSIITTLCVLSRLFLPWWRYFCSKKAFHPTKQNWKEHKCHSNPPRKKKREQFFLQLWFGWKNKCFCFDTEMTSTSLSTQTITFSLSPFPVVFFFFWEKETLQIQFSRVKLLLLCILFWLPQNIVFFFGEKQKKKKKKKKEKEKRDSLQKQKNKICCFCCYCSAAFSKVTSPTSSGTQSWLSSSLPPASSLAAAELTEEWPQKKSTSLGWLDFVTKQKKQNKNKMKCKPVVDETRSLSWLGSTCWRIPGKRSLTSVEKQKLVGVEKQKLVGCWKQKLVGFWKQKLVGFSDFFPFFVRTELCGLFFLITFGLVWSTDNKCIALNCHLNYKMWNDILWNIKVKTWNAAEQQDQAMFHLLGLWNEQLCHQIWTCSPPQFHWSVAHQVFSRLLEVSLCQSQSLCEQPFGHKIKNNKTRAVPQWA